MPTTSSPYVTGGTMAPIAEPQLPMGDVGGMGGSAIPAPSLPSLGDLTPATSMSARPRKGIFKFIPSFRRKQSAPVFTGGDGQWPAEGTVLTEEQFNALPGAAGVPPQQQPYTAPSAQMRPGMQTQPLHPTPEVRLPPAAQQPKHYQTSLIVPAKPASRQTARPAAIRPVSTTSSMPAVARYGSQMNQNFGGSWGQRVNGPATIPAADAVAGAQLLELPGKNESYEMWPAANAAKVAQPMMDARNAVGVAANHDQATQLLPVSNSGHSTVMPAIVPAVR